jgi:hypothetical protein
MTVKNLDNQTLVLLILLSITVFIRTLVYITFDSDMLDLDSYLNIETESTIDVILTFFAIIRLLLSTIILYKRSVGFDILSFGLIYLILSSFLRFYYQYLIYKNDHSKTRLYIDRYQDINALVLFLISLYIIKLVFFT